MKNKNNRIALLTPSLQFGGAERVLAITSNLLTKAGYDVYILVYDNDDISYEYSGRLINLKSKAKSNFVLRVVTRLERIVKMSYYNYKYKFGTVISLLYSANIVNYYSIGKTQKILSCRGYTDYKANGYKYSKMIKNIDSFIVQTDKMKSDFSDKFNIDQSKLKVIANPFDVNDIVEKSTEDVEIEIMNFINSHTTICTVGSFKRDKGYWHLIKSFIEVKKNIKNAGLIFIGHNGELENSLKDMVKRSGLEKDIIFLGHTRNPFKYVANCALYVCTSLNEGFPNSLVESMACGIPVLSTDCLTGPREILSDRKFEDQITEVKNEKYGVLVPRLDEELNTDITVIDSSDKILSNAIIDLLKNKEMLASYSKRGRERAYQFGLEKYLEKLIGLIC